MSSELSVRRVPARTLAPLLVALVAAVALVAGLTPAATGTTPTAVAAVPMPAVPKNLPTAIDDFAEYEGQTLCSLTVKPGTRKLEQLINTTYGTSDIGDLRPCADGGQSEHKEGRAIDWMISTPKRADATAFLTWLLTPDANGNSGAMARRLGVMYIGWNNRIWRSYNTSLGWSDLKGCSVAGSVKNTSASYATYCHRNHIHISLSWNGAQGTTSFWTGKVDTTPICEPQSDLVTRSPGAPTVRSLLLDTASGYGTAGACLLGVDRWSGDGRGLRVKVDVPTAPGRYGLTVQVYTYKSNAPGSLLLDTSATSPWAIPAARTAPYVIPIGADGVLSVSLNAGHAAVRLVGTGIVRLPDLPPVVAPVTPKPTAAVTPPVAKPVVKPAIHRVTLSLPARVLHGRAFVLKGGLVKIPAASTIRRYLWVDGRWQLRGSAVKAGRGTWRMTAVAPTKARGRYVYRIAVVYRHRVIAWSTPRATVVR